MSKIYKVVKKGREVITFYGSNRMIKLYYTVTGKVKFKFRGHVYYLDDFFIPTPKDSCLEEFEGYLYFYGEETGMVIKLIKENNIKVYTFITQ